MKWIKILFWVIGVVALTVFCNINQPLGLSFPALGKFFCPFTGFWQNAEPHSLPATRELKIAGPQSEVEVVFDERRVPHIFASDLKDAMFAQGYLSAMDRLWQMDLAVRAVSGRLSEVLGQRTLEYDKSKRLKGMHRAAFNDIIAWRQNAEDMAIIQAYCDGVNARIKELSGKDLPLEFKLLGYEPEPWSPYNVALFLKSMAETLCSGNDDIEATNALSKLGRQRFDFLFPELNPRQSPIIPDDTARPAAQELSTPQNTVEPATPQTISLSPDQLLPKPPPFIGSNNWAVSGSKSYSGHPILCNDPHLNLTLPSIWYEVQIHTPGLNAYGVSFPGAPGIAIGFNEHITWGETNVGHDVLDYYQVNWTDTSKTSYWLNGQSTPVDVTDDTIWVKGSSQPVIMQVKHTVWGPVVHEGGKDLAMHWVATDRPDKRPFYEFGTFLRLMKARNYPDYVEALKGFGSPAQNFAFAAGDGDIAITVNGLLPLKGAEQGRFVQIGDSTLKSWKGFIPYEALPRIKNPARGFVASANQRSTGAAYPFYYNGGFDDYRGRYINRYLQNHSTLSIDQMKQLQNDTRSLFPEDALPALSQRLDSGRLEKKHLDLLGLLKNWNYAFDKELTEPTLFELWWNHTYRLIYDEFYQWNDSSAILFPEKWRTIELLENFPNDGIFDDLATPAAETAVQIVTSSFLLAVDDFEKLPPEDRQWKKYKSAMIPHLGRVPGLGIDYLELGGSAESPNAVKKTHGPSWRMIVEMAKQPKALGVFPGGPSGNPGSRFYDSQVKAWSSGDYFELWLMQAPNDDRRPVMGRLKLVPIN